MTNVIITMKSRTIHKFLHVGRLGGSYTKNVRYEGRFVIVTDEYYSETAFPSVDVEKVETQQF